MSKLHPSRGVRCTAYGADAGETLVCTVNTTLPINLPRGGRSATINGLENVKKFTKTSRDFAPRCYTVLPSSLLFFSSPVGGPAQSRLAVQRPTEHRPAVSRPIVARRIGPSDFQPPENRTNAAATLIISVRNTIACTSGVINNARVTAAFN